MAALRQSAEYPYTWKQFQHTALQLGDALAYTAQYDLADCYRKHYLGDTAFNFTEPAPVFTNVYDANEMVARLWNERAHN